MPDYLKGLTEQQLIAATEIDGPMMVIAGPGTGKTQVLSARIAHILKTTDVDPKNILVLTFTDSGTVAVRKRLSSMIGNAAYYVNIFTFHSFAQNVIEEYKEYFYELGNKVISDIDQITLLRNILDENNLKFLKLIDDPYFYLNDIKFSISNLKRETVTPEILKSKTIEEIEGLQNDPNSLNKRTKILKVDISKRIERLNKTLELVEIYREYEKRIHEKKIHDFDDMIISVLNGVKNNANLKADLQERYLYFLVDEYQDTNSAQNQIVENIASSDFFEDPNLFVVGDDDQSIYRFQGASLSNILYFKKKFPQTKVVVMTQSHRSTQLILNAAQNVIQNNVQRLVNVMSGLEKNLFSNILIPDSNVTIFEFPHMRYEYLWITQKIQNLVSEGYKYSDFAILLRNNSEVNDLSQILLSHNIPITSDKSSNILDDTDIRDLITLIRTISNPQDDRLFFASMCQSRSNITALDRIKFSELRSKEKLSFFDLSQNLPLLQEKSIGIKTNSLTEIDTNDFSEFNSTIQNDNSQNSIKEFSDFLLDYNSKINEEPFIIFLDHLIKKINFTNFISNSSQRIIKLNRLVTIFDYIKSKYMANPLYSYEDFLNFINIVEDYNQTIKEKTLDLNTNSVRIMTAHKSKGLEFPIVIIPKAIDRYWGNNSGRQNIILPESITNSVKLSKDEKNEEERRLFFVALTRAKERIFLTYSQKYETFNGIKESNQSMFLNELGKEYSNIVNPEVKITEEDIEKELEYKPVLKEFEDELENNYIKEKLTNFKLTATALNNYLICPKKFFYNNLLKIPNLRSDKQSFGIAMHKALELFYNEQIEKNILPDKIFLINNFKNALKNEIISKQNYESLEIKGIEGLSGYYDNIIIKKLEFEKPIFNEVNFDKRNVFLDNIPITGKIDAVSVTFTDNEPIALVVDYKTGRIKSRRQIETFIKNDRGELIPSNYYSQLMFYKILTDNDKTWKYKTSKGIIDFIEGKNGKYKREIFEYNDEEIEVFKELIHKTMYEIKDLNFEKIKKGKICSECVFNKICWGG